MTIKANNVEQFPGGAWDDFRIPVTQTKTGSNLKPDFDFVNVGLLFPQNDASEKAYVNVQLSHSWKLTTNLHPHIHYVQSSENTPTFIMDYRICEKGGDPTIEFTSVSSTINAHEYPGSGSILQVCYFPEIDMSNINTVSTMIDIIFYRNDNVVVGDVLVKEFDIHYQSDSLGSDQMGSKSFK